MNGSSEDVSATADVARSDDDDDAGDDADDDDTAVGVASQQQPDDGVGSVGAGARASQEPTASSPAANEEPRADVAVYPSARFNAAMAVQRNVLYLYVRRRRLAGPRPDDRSCPAPAGPACSGYAVPSI